MNPAHAAEEELKNGDPAAALQRLQEQVRARPEDAKLRVFLFQLLCVLGNWERALNQLEVATNLDAGALVMGQMYGAAVRCEAVRSDVFDGRRSPMIFGEPDQWLALLIESLLTAGKSDPAGAERLRLQAFEQAPATAGTLNGEAFEWIADADSRLGPVVEAIVNGRYYWLPFSRISTITMEAPEDLRDVVWMPAQFEFQNGGEVVGLIPSRYPGSEKAGDGLLALGRKTLWEEFAPDAHRGLGQRVFATDYGDVPLLEVRSVTLQAADTTATVSD